MAHNRTYRLGLAFCLAVVVHFMVMSMEIANKPTMIPDFHIPRSVNVFLGQPQQPQSISDKQETIEPIVEQVVAEPVLKEPFIEKKSPVQESVTAEKPDIPVPPIKKIPLPEKAENIPVVEKKTATVSSEPLTTDTGAQQSSIIKKKVDTGRQRVGAVRVARPMYRENSPPTYPKRARKRGYEGTVVLQVLVNRQGRVDELRVDSTSGHAMLDRAAQGAVERWLFEPGRQGNKKMAMWVKVPVTFKLDE
ncbi:MAG: energy transducer TonB [Proteobacteria bacterium]|nr:energy transducer TonB [Pseudomonadota bacterium]